MNEGQDLKLIDLDYLTGNHHLQMMKAALPYMEVPEQRMLSVFVKMSELQRTISFFRDEEVTTMGICFLEHQDKEPPVEMLKAIRPYVSVAKQGIIELVSGFPQGGRTSMANMFQNFGGLGGRDALFSAAQLFGQQGQDQTPPVVPEGEIPDSETPSSEILDPSPRHNSSFTMSDAASSRPVLDQIEGFLSSGQQSRIEMTQTMVQVMQ